MLVPREAIRALVLKNPIVSLSTAPRSNLLLSFSAFEKISYINYMLSL